MTGTPARTPAPDADRFGAADVVRFALEKYTLGRGADGMLFAVPSSPRAPRVAREIRSLRSELSRAIWREKGYAVGREAVGTAIETLLGIASDAPVQKVHLRAARLRASIHLDLADTSGRFVEVSSGGWELRDPIAEDDPDAHRAVFKRTAATAELPAPTRSGERGDLARLLGLAEDDPRFMLAWGWLVASLFEDVPRPILWALGPQGSGKSTRARMLLNVVDPVDALGREPGKNERDDTTAASGRFLPSFDNIGNVTPATSDWLCRLVTGVEVSRRALYSDDDLRVTMLRRSGVATSIVLPFGLGPDALERLVLLDLERVPESERSPESTLWAEFERLRPGILGILLDDVAGVLRHLPVVSAEKRDLPRMADYSLILHALDAHLDLDPWEGYAEAYSRSVRGVMKDRAASDPLTAALVRVAKTAGGAWKGTAEQLLARLEPFRPDDARVAWPVGAASLSAALTRSHETLRAAGLDVDRKKSNGARLVILGYTPTEDDEDDTAAAA